MPQTTDGPPLTPEAAAQAGAISTFIHERLKAIAKQLAKSNGCEFTQKRDVNIAFRAIKEAGLEAPPPPAPWYHRPDFRVGVGALLMGVSPSVGGLAASVIGAMSNAPICFWVFVIIIPIIMGVVGFCWAWSGWVRKPV